MKGCRVHDDRKLDFLMGGGVAHGKGGNRGCCMHGNARNEGDGRGWRAEDFAVPSPRRAIRPALLPI